MMTFLGNGQLNGAIQTPEDFYTLKVGFPGLTMFSDDL